MKRIELTQGKITTVDDEDFEWLSQYEWFVVKNVSHGRVYWYAKRYGGIFMHREILKTPKGLVVDHKDHDGLNNQRYNIRNCSNSYNRQNQIGSKQYQGTTYDRGVYRSLIKVDGIVIRLGNYTTELEAAIIYDFAAIKYFGEEAKTNFTLPVLLTLYKLNEPHKRHK